MLLANNVVCCYPTLSDGIGQECKMLLLASNGGCYWPTMLDVIGQLCSMLFANDVDSVTWGLNSAWPSGIAMLMNKVVLQCYVNTTKLKKITKFNFKFALDQILEFYFLNGDTVGQKLQKVVVDRNILSCSFEFPTALHNHPLFKWLAFYLKWNDNYKFNTPVCLFCDS